MPLAYGVKKAFSCIRAVSIIPMPVSWTALRRASNSSAAADATPVINADDRISTVWGTGRRNVARVTSAQRQQQRWQGSEAGTDDARPFSPATALSTLAHTGFGSYGSCMAGESIQAPSQSPVMLGPAGRSPSQRVARSQARTLELEMEVAAMEERLRMSRELLPAVS